MSQIHLYLIACCLLQCFNCFLCIGFTFLERILGAWWADTSCLFSSTVELQVISEAVLFLVFHSQLSSIVGFSCDTLSSAVSFVPPAPFRSGLQEKAWWLSCSACLYVRLCHGSLDYWQYCCFQKMWRGFRNTRLGYYSSCLLNEQINESWDCYSSRKGRWTNTYWIENTLYSIIPLLATTMLCAKY